ncbi:MULTISPECIES: cytochrome P450 [unclassified Streptomyces]|uniref:cytochrome P450 n=1 Tax=unclassified Streptomyces TaxID=2593676 RepID=UPI003863AD4B|nr:cytochrome P450 [Streptomyces sp. NBC_01017]WSV35119.1 cytochrome P450 [Streptomyces sp. NBC_01017]
MSNAFVIDNIQTNPLHALLDPQVRPDPYGIHAELRESSPLRVDEGLVIVGDYRSCLAAMRNPALGSDTLKSSWLKGVLPQSEAPVLDSIFFMDPPDHPRKRRLISKAFTPRITARYEPWIQGLVDGAISEIADKDSFDGVRDYANRLSMGTICELMDLPPSDVPMLKEWSDQLALATELPTLVAAFRNSEMFSAEQLAGFDRTSMAIHAYFADLIHKRRKKPGEDLISSLIQTEEEGHSLTRHEVTNVLLNLFAAAHESVTNLISSGMLILSRYPDQLSLLRDDPSIAPLLVEEVLRYDAPVHVTARVALSSTCVGEIDVEPGTIVILLLAAGNRDEAEFPQADRFQGNRKTKGIGLAFGAGPHFCLGASLAKLEAEIALKAFAERLTDFTVDEDSLTYRPHVVARGLQSMTVRRRP